MARRSSAVVVSALSLVAVVFTGPPGHSQLLSCNGTLGHAQPLSCDELSDCERQKEQAYADAETDLAGMTDKETCLKGLLEAFEGDPPVLPEGATVDFAACIDSDIEPTPEDTEVALEQQHDLVKQKRDEVGDLLLEYEAVKLRTEDGCTLND